MHIQTAPNTIANKHLRKQVILIPINLTNVKKITPSQAHFILFAPHGHISHIHPNRSGDTVCTRIPKEQTYSHFNAIHTHRFDGKRILIALDHITRRSGYAEPIYVPDFLKMLWSGEIF